MMIKKVVDAIVMAAMLGLILFSFDVFGRDLGQWEESRPETRAWFRSLMQPDTLDSTRPISCCGEGDAYWADEYHIAENGDLIATITDERDDTPLQRMHVPVGTTFVVPPRKIVDVTRQRGNPTGHTIIFLGVNYSELPGGRFVLCWVGGGGA